MNVSEALKNQISHALEVLANAAAGMKYSPETLETANDILARALRMGVTRV